MKIWSIAGDVLSPGNNYDVGNGSGTQPAPILRETKSAYLSYHGVI
jgi:hypothetical protein